MGEIDTSLMRTNPAWIRSYAQETLAEVIVGGDLITPKYFEDVLVTLRGFNKVALADLSRELRYRHIEASSMLIFAWSEGRGIPDCVCKRINILTALLEWLDFLYSRA